MTAAGSSSRWRTCASLPMKSSSLTLPQAIPRLDHVEVPLELGAMGPVALLEPAGGAVHADPGRDDPVRLAGLGDQIPQAGAPLRRPAQRPKQGAHPGEPG